MKRSLWTLLLLTVLFSCSDSYCEKEFEKSLPEEPLTAKRNISEALKIASMARIEAGLTTRSSSQIDRSNVVIVTGKTTRSSEDTVFYAVNFGNNEGFAIISSYRNIPPLFAICESGTYSSSENLLNEGFQSYMNQAISYSSNLTPIPGPVFKEDPSYTDTIFSREKAYPKIDFKWGQFWPANIYCPNLIAGCGPVAAAQILGAMKQPVSMNYTFPEKDIDKEPLNWNSLSKHKQGLFSQTFPDYMIGNHIGNCDLKELEGHKSIGRFIRQIGLLSKAAYKENQTSTCFDDVTPLISSLSGKPIMKSGESPYALFESLINGGNLVAYVRGSDEDAGGHAWVADGAWEIGMIIRSWVAPVIWEQDPDNPNQLVCVESGEIKKYLHFNWGWNGDSNGYFLINVLKPDSAYEYDNSYNNLNTYDFSNEFRYALYSLD